MPASRPLLGLLLALCLAAAVGAQGGSGRYDPPRPLDMSPTSVIVKRRAAAGSVDAAEYVDAAAMAIAEWVAHPSPPTAHFGKHIGGGLHIVPVQEGQNVSQMLDSLRLDPEVQYAVPDYVLYATRTPNDPEFKRQWGLTRIGARSAWSIAYGGGHKASKEPTVCVVDSGVDYTHPDLKANLHPDVGFNAIAGMNSSDPYDDFGHGTHVAGIIAASGNNSLGISGVLWRNVNVLSCKFMTSGGWGLTSDAIQCVSWCVSKGAEVISNSWSGGQNDNPPLRQAVEAAGKAGALFVVAAGNDGLDIDSELTYPASYAAEYDHVLSVGASSEYDDFAPFSNFGSKAVQLSAPGTWIYSTVPGGKYDYRSGSSMAAPFVSGAAALLLAAARSELGRDLSAAELRQRLVAAAEPLRGLKGRSSTGARLRVDWALQDLLGRTRSPVSPAFPRPGAPIASGMVSAASAKKVPKQQPQKKKQQTKQKQKLQYKAAVPTGAARWQQSVHQKGAAVAGAPAPRPAAQQWNQQQHRRRQLRAARRNLRPQQ